MAKKLSHSQVSEVLKYSQKAVMFNYWDAYTDVCNCNKHFVLVFQAYYRFLVYFNVNGYTSKGSNSTSFVFASPFTWE